MVGLEPDSGRRLRRRKVPGLCQPHLTLVFLGGSTVACIYVEEENRFPYLVCNLLAQKTGKRITSINSGVGGNNSLHSLDILLNKLVPVRPDVVVMMHNINDLVALIFERTYWSKNPSRAAIVNFSFYKDLTGFKALATLCRARRITPVLMTQFNRYRPNPDPKVLKVMQGYQAESGIPVSEFIE